MALGAAPAGPSEPGGWRGRRTLLLLGGNEWCPPCGPADSWWLARAARPEVTVVTSAAQDIPETAVRWAAAHFARLGAAVRGCFVQTRSDAEDPAILAQLGGASAIYLCGGDPGAAQAVLFQSAAAEALHTAYRGGIPLAGSSAGAMVLGGECLVPGENFGLRPGLGLVPDLVVVPHWNSAGRRWREVAIELGRESRVVAIDESTGVCWDGAGWQVRGQGRAVLVSGGGERAVEGGGLPPPVE